MFSNELCIRILLAGTFDTEKNPQDFLLNSVFDETYELMENERGNRKSLWSDYTSSALEKLKAFISVNKPVEIYRLAISKQTQEMSACVESNLVKERISITQKKGKAEDDDICRVPFGPNRLPSKMPAKNN